MIISIHTFLTEGDFVQSLKKSHRRAFQSTPSLRKVTTLNLQGSENIFISIHTFLTEGDTLISCELLEYQFISIHTFLTEGDKRPDWYSPTLRISIHTFLTEGDLPILLNQHQSLYFNPHLPYGR